MRSTNWRRLGLLAGALGLGGGAGAGGEVRMPETGGDLVFGGEAKVNSLDMYASNTISTRNNAMNIFESLMTRDEANNPILELAEAMTESPDHLTYTFKLRQGSSSTTART